VNARLQRIRRWLVRALVLTGLVALALSGGYGLQFALGGLAAVAGAWAVQHRTHDKQAWGIASVLVSVATVLLPLVFGLPWFEVVIGLLLYLQVHRARIRRRTWDDRFSLLFSLLAVLLVLTRSTSPALALVLLVLGLGLPAALLVLQVEDVALNSGVSDRALRGRHLGPLAALSLGVAVLGAVLFVLIPRLDAQVLSDLGDRTDMAGFAGEVELGELGEIKDNPELVLRATVTDHNGTLQSGPFYFRGVALDDFDGRRWSRTRSGNRQVNLTVAQPDPEPGVLRMEVLMEPMSSAPVFTVGRVERLETGDGPVTVDGSGGLRFEGGSERREYVTWSRTPQVDPNAAPARRPPADSTLALPEDLDPRIAELAAQWVAEAGATTPWEITVALETRLRQDYDYTVIPTAGASSQPLSAFFFETRSGHCEYFATALAVMLRTQGIPSRIVNGFYAGEVNDLGGYISVRQSHAHSWVEARLGRNGWVPFDATPSGGDVPSAGLIRQIGDTLNRKWFGVVLTYDLRVQLDTTEAMGRRIAELTEPGTAATVRSDPASDQLLGVGVVLALAVGGAMGSVRLARALVRQPGARKRAPKGVAAQYAKARKQLARKGWTAPPSFPPVQAAEYIVEQAGPSADPLLELAWLVYQVRYGGHDDRALLDQARAHVDALQVVPQSTEGAP
jgi:hypothetical protein